MTDKQWFQKFEQAAPEDRKRMLTERKEEQSRRLVEQVRSASDVDEESAGPKPEDRERAREWLDRVQGSRPTDLDAL